MNENGKKILIVIGCLAAGAAVGGGIYVALDHFGVIGDKDDNNLIPDTVIPEGNLSE